MYSTYIYFLKHKIPKYIPHNSHNSFKITFIIQNYYKKNVYDVFIKEKFAHKGKIVHIGDEVLIPLVKKNLTIYTKGRFKSILQDFAKIVNTSLRLL